MAYFYVDILIELHCTKFCTEANVSHRLTPSCIFSENLVEIFKNLQDFRRYSKKFRRTYENSRGTLQNTLLI